MNYTAAEVEQYVQEMDVKFIRLAFTDLFGTLKNISILAEELPRAFRDGVSFDASAVAGSAAAAVFLTVFFSADAACFLVVSATVGSSGN